MISKLAYSIAIFLAKYKVFGCEYVEVYQLGMELIISTIINFLTVILIGIFANSITETVIFLFLFVPLRFYSGGYHAESYLKCFLGFCSVYVILIVLLKITPENLQAILGICLIIISSIIIIVFSPIEHENNPLGDFEKKKFKKIAVILTIIEVLLLILILTFVNNRFFYTGSLTLFSIAILQVISLLKNWQTAIFRYRNKRNRGEKNEKTTL